MAPIKEMAGFAVLPLRMPSSPSLPEGFQSPVHYVYVRPNAPKIPTPSDSRSLFLANVPVDSTAAHWEAVFASLVGSGRFQSMVFEDERRQRDNDAAAAKLPGSAARLQALQNRKRKREGKNDGLDGEENGEEQSLVHNDNDLYRQERLAKLPTAWSRPLRRSGSTAVVCLIDDRAVPLVLKAIARLHKSHHDFPLWPETPLGASWLAAHHDCVFPDRDAVSKKVNAFSAVYDRRARAADALAKRLRNLPDDDGFVTVTRGSAGNSASRLGPARMTEAQAALAKQQAKEQRKRDEMTSFYRFQVRERNKAEQAQMVRRFDEDAARVQEMRKKKGKFAPEV